MALVPYGIGSGDDLPVSEQIQGNGDIMLSSIKRWWRGEISGKRCAKNVIDAGLLYVTTSAGTCAGAGLGALIGTPGGPVGNILGAVIGGATGLAGGWVMGKVTQGCIQKFTCKVFDLPKTAALDKAYNFFGLRHDATNADIRETYRRLALVYHPDKGGNEKDFVKLKIFYDIIRAARGMN